VRERLRDSEAPTPCAFDLPVVNALSVLLFPRAEGLLNQLPNRLRTAGNWHLPNRHSSMRAVSNSANTPSMSRKHLPAAVLVSIGCSVAFNEAPRADRADDPDDASQNTVAAPPP
jgi:hypothetical protein